MKRFFSMILIFLGFPGIICAAVIHVPGERTTIQAAIDAAIDGDIIMIASGVYTGDGNRDLTVMGKSLTFMSEHGAGTCQIDCEGIDGDPHRIFDLDSSSANPVEMFGMTFTGGYIEYDGMAATGGAIKCSNGAFLELTDCVFDGNRGYYGGGVLCESESSVKIQNCLFTGNQGYFGGAVSGRLASTVIVDNCSFQDNQGVLGGGIWSYPIACTLKIINSRFVSNLADSGAGVSIIGDDQGCLTSLCNSPSSYFINQCVFEQNESGSLGGGVHCDLASLTVANTIFKANYASAQGGALSVSSSPISLFNVMMFENTSGYNGGAISIFGGQNTTRIQNATIVDNHAGFGGGIAFFYMDFCEIIDSIIYRNEASEGSQLAIRNIGQDPVIGIDFCDIEYGFDGLYSEYGGGWNWGSSNIILDPEFASGPEGAYYLGHIEAGQSKDSPCRNAGSIDAASACILIPPELLCEDQSTTRTDGVLDSETVDIGYHGAPFQTECPHTGDVDDSGSLSPNDALLVMQMYLGLNNHSNARDICAADCNGDGGVTPGDALCIFRHYLEGSCSCVDPLNR